MEATKPNSALADCPEGSYPIGIDATGNRLGCMTVQLDRIPAEKDSRWCLGMEIAVVLLLAILCAIICAEFK